MIPVFTRTPQGDLIIEVDLQRFKETFQQTPPEHRLQLLDGRMALRSEDPLNPGTYTVHTVHPEVWKRMAFAAKRQTASMKEFLGRFEAGGAAARGRLCRRCGSELKARMEKEQWWAFTCPVCEQRETWGKYIVGGTVGGGDKEIV